MKIHWHWGTKLLIAMILFMALLIGFVIMSMKQTYNLVEKDYYPKALEYQDKIDKENNTKALAEKVLIEDAEDQVIFTFPGIFSPGELSGEIMFYRPSDKRMDVLIPIQLDSTSQQRYNTSGLLKGKYLIKIDYEVEGKGYYQEESILIKM